MGLLPGRARARVRRGPHAHRSRFRRTRGGNCGPASCAVRLPGARGGITHESTHVVRKAPSWRQRRLAIFTRRAAACIVDSQANGKHATSRAPREFDPVRIPWHHGVPGATTVAARVPATPPQTIKQLMENTHFHLWLSEGVEFLDRGVLDHLRRPSWGATGSNFGRSGVVLGRPGAP